MGWGHWEVMVFQNRNPPSPLSCPWVLAFGISGHTWLGYQNEQLRRKTRLISFFWIKGLRTGYPLAPADYADRQWWSPESQETPDCFIFLMLLFRPVPDILHRCGSSILTEVGIYHSSRWAQMALFISRDCWPSERRR